MHVSVCPHTLILWGVMKTIVWRTNFENYSIRCIARQWNQWYLGVLLHFEKEKKTASFSLAFPLSFIPLCFRSVRQANVWREGEREIKRGGERDTERGSKERVGRDSLSDIMTYNMTNLWQFFFPCKYFVAMWPSFWLVCLSICVFFNRLFSLYVFLYAPSYPL